MPRRIKALLGFGCLSAVLVAGVITHHYRRVSQSLTTDPGKIANIVRTLLPGAEVPEGYAGAIAVDFAGMRLVAMGPQGIPRERMDTVLGLMSLVDDKKGQRDWEKEFRNSLSKDQAAKIIRRESVELTVGNVTVPGSSALRVGTQGGQVREIILLVGHPTQADRVVGIFFEAPQEGFSRAPLDRFLSKLSVRSLSAK